MAEPATGAPAENDANGASDAAPPRATETTEDRLLGGRVVLAQPAAGYRAAIDPVLLAAAVPARGGETVLELGCGVGAAALCLLARVPGCRVVGLELQPALVVLAHRNAVGNGVDDRLAAVEGDLRDPPAALLALAPTPAGFDQVMLNPPFLPAGRHTPPSDPMAATACQENTAELAQWIAAAYRRLRPGGGLTLIHRADRVDDVCAALAERFGAVELIPLWPKAGQPARRVLVRARKGSRAPATLSSGLVLHQADGRYTAAAEAVLREAAALTLPPDQPTGHGQ